ncbi:hypothetical protein VCUG_02237 [Vavraia culicis subsp. floridensis]|uniref:Uncharacterized protein n=1 Tax=Vavraia culicis (isolate floridensis) TaxID=948595 RepID=L2GT41_VAVCU|nr:uncharacterized protein VCUG_02237 [Vavraia culicis subsp. floridensis]ELA46270.1 hypothetical protein VCUG_02237 [Vavraia culicis subsp. floridensis]
MLFTCKFCIRSNLSAYNDLLYCPKCKIYLKEKDGRLFYHYVPSKIDGTFRSLSDLLCAKCRTMNTTITCTNFDDFYKKVQYCDMCKVRGYMVLRNNFYKNLPLCHMVRRKYKLLSYVIITLLMLIMYQYALSRNLIVFVDEVYTHRFSFLKLGTKLAVYWALRDHSNIRLFVLMGWAWCSMFCKYESVFVVRISSGLIDDGFIDRFHRLQIGY